MNEREQIQKALSGLHASPIDPEEIMKMNWLVANIEGDIPEIEELKDEAKAIVELKGVAEDEE